MCTKLIYQIEKIFYLFIIFLLVSSWFFLTWPNWNDFRLSVDKVYTTDTNILPSTIGASDDTGETTINEITTDNSSVNPDTLSAVNTNDGTYTVDKSNTMHFSAFNTSAIPAANSITAVVLHLQYGAENGYNGTNSVWYNIGAGQTNTTITPTDISGWSSDITYNLYAQGVDTLTELQNLQMGFTSNDGGGADAVHFDYLWVTVTHTNTAPSAPSQNNPTNGQTGVSTTPTFTMTATDPDGNNIGYKVTIYSNSACTTVVSTHDQAVNSTGWAGTNSSCTASPNSCYTSGTQGSFALQAGDVLTVSTQYWWKASAKDPDGVGGFTDSATCNSFTTNAGISISLSTDGSVSFGGLGLEAISDTTAGGINDVETVSVDSGPADLNIKSTVFAEGANTWTLDTTNGSNQVQWEFSPDGSSWTTFAIADTEYSLATNVSQGNTQDVYFRINMPIDTTSYNQYSSTVTIVASTP